MADLKKDISDENLTQKDIVQLLLHNAQHMVTREDLKSDIRELKQDMFKLEGSLKQDMSKLEGSLKQELSELEGSLKQDMSKLEGSLKQDMSKLEVNIAYLSTKFDRMQWLIVTAILSIFLKDYLLAFIQS
jgi:predicted  nucleic acid-binding Zn-ribbon protein